MPENVRMALFVAGGLIFGPLIVLGLLRLARFLAVNLLAWLTMRPGVRYTGWRWRVVRNYVLDRDGHHCRYCRQSYRSMDVHHRQPLSQLGSHQTWNLDTTCRSCHTGIHPHMALKKNESRRSRAG